MHLDESAHCSKDSFASLVHADIEYIGLLSLYSCFVKAMTNSFIMYGFGTENSCKLGGGPFFFTKNPKILLVCGGGVGGVDQVMVHTGAFISSISQRKSNS